MRIIDHERKGEAATKKIRTGSAHKLELRQTLGCERMSMPTLRLMR